MADGDVAGPGRGWDWLGQEVRPLGGTLVFARGVTPEQVIEAHGMDPGGARLLPYEAVEDELPVEVEGVFVTPWVRAGRVGEWAFGVSEIGDPVDAGSRLSAGTDAVVVWWTPKPTDGVWYLVDGHAVTIIEPSFPWRRGGTEPDRFVPEMRRAGLATEQPGFLDEERPSPRWEQWLEFDELVAALGMLTLALGIRLPAGVARGPLLTARYGPGVS